MSFIRKNKNFSTVPLSKIFLAYVRAPGQEGENLKLAFPPDFVQFFSQIFIKHHKFPGFSMVCRDYSKFSRSTEPRKNMRKFFQ